MSRIFVHNDFIVDDHPNGQPMVALEHLPDILATHLEWMAWHYPAEVFGADGTTCDSVAGTALRVVLTQEVLRLRGLA